MAHSSPGCPARRVSLAALAQYEAVEVEAQVHTVHCALKFFVLRLNLQLQVDNASIQLDLQTPLRWLQQGQSITRPDESGLDGCETSLGFLLEDGVRIWHEGRGCRALAERAPVPV